MVVFYNDKLPASNTAVSSEAWAKLRVWASVAGRVWLLLPGRVDHASLKTAVVYFSLKLRKIGLNML